MKKVFIKTLSLIIVCCIIYSNLSLMASATSIDSGTANTNVTGNEIIQSALESKGINVIITSDNKIMLAKIDPESIEHANKILQSEQASTAGTSASMSMSTSTSYPTSWTHMGNYDVYSSKKLTCATKTAFSAALTNFLTGKTPSVQGIIASAVAAYGTYWFVNSSTEDVYYLAQYYYREMGPGFFDSNGTFIGDYQIKKFDRTTKNSNYTGGQVVTRIESSTIIEPWF